LLPIGGLGILTKPFSSPAVAVNGRFLKDGMNFAGQDPPRRPPRRPGDSRSQRGRVDRRPRPGALAAGFIGGDARLVGERDADVVEPLEQSAADLVVDAERDLATIEPDLLLDEVDLPVPGGGERAAVLV